MRQRVASLSLFFLLLIAAPASAKTVYHTVESGDSLWSIAGQYHVSVADLEKRNGLTDASVLQLGQEIAVPGKDAPAITGKKESIVPVWRHGQFAPKKPVAKAGNASSNVPVWRRGRFAHKKPVAKSGATVSKSAQVAALAALWSATHGGVIPADIPGATPFELASKALALDERIARTAMRYIGVPYMWGGTSFSGMDCSGFVQTVFSLNGISLPRMADEQFALGQRIATGLLLPGDLVFFETYTSGASHVGIYVGKGQFVHASLRGVRVDPLSMDYYASRYIGARRINK